jgi:hypothetical protein
MKHLKSLFCNTIISSFILLSACTSAQITPVQTDTIATVNIAQATSTVEPTIVSILNATNIPAATADAICPKVNSNIQFNLPADSSEFGVSILKYLNEGGDPTKIQPTTTPPDVPSFYSVAADIDGDSLLEIVVSTRDLFEKPATIRVYHCGQNDYYLAKSFTPQNMGFGIIELVTEIFQSEPSFVIIRALCISGWGQDFFCSGLA